MLQERIVEDMDVDVLRSMTDEQRIKTVNAWLEYRDAIHDQIREERKNSVALCDTVVMRVK